MTTELTDERRMLARLLHELKVPVIVIRGAAEFLQRELAQKNVKLSQDYVDDILTWCELLRRLMVNAEAFTSREIRGTLRCELRPTLLWKEVVMPAVKQIRPLLSERGFSPTAIRTEGFDHLPQLWVDRNFMQQVIFNLLSNSIKYAYADPSAFQIQIVGEQSMEGYCILFRDYGPGIPEGWETSIFEEGVRGPDAEQRSVSGEGLGLWVVREILLAHGGSAEVSHRHYPTEFRITLPVKSAKPPRRETDEKTSLTD